ncbi:hypothetical protein OROHE_025729 [Orobanche hederae]
MKERRKVQMVEHPGQRIPQVARLTSTTKSRPLSADDIQKAKMRAQYMQSKLGKTVTCSDEKVMPESFNRCTSSHISSVPSFSVPPVKTKSEDRKLDNAVFKPDKSHETFLDIKEPPWKKYKRIEIPWQTPPEVKIREEWCVADGANSKEVEGQKNRIRREREIVYRSIQEIPSDPKEPWDREMDPDDTLTPEIPIEQLPDVEPLEPPSDSHIGNSETVAPPVASTSSENMPEPDLELLAELLKNPQLVFALTSGQAGNLSSDATVKLLDMIKANGVGSLGKLAGDDENKVVVSLPSPTPSTEPVPSGARHDFSRNPFSRQPMSANGNIHQATGNVLPIQPQEMVVPARTLKQPLIPATTILAHQPSVVVQQSAHVMVPPVASLRARTHSHVHHQNVLPNNSSNIQHLTTEIMLNSSRAQSNVVGSSNWAQSRVVTPPNRAQFNVVSNNSTLRARQNFESNHRYQNNRNVNGHNAYDGGPMREVVLRGSRNDLLGRPEFESWSPDNSPPRRHEDSPGQYYRDSSMNSRHGYVDERAMQQNLGGARNKRWRDNRR